MSQKTTPARPAKVQKRPPSSGERLIGYGVLGFGVVAMMAVGVLAVQRYAPKPSTALVGAAAQQDDHFAPASIPAPQSHQRPIPRQGVVKDGRAKRVADADIRGVWESVFLDYYSLFHIQNGTYQIIVSRDVPGKPRYYARGRYALDGANLILTPDPAMGNPQDEDSGRRYLPLTNRSFTVELRVGDDRQLWFSGPVDPEFPRQNPIYPLIQYSGEDGILWTRKAQ